MSISMTVLKPFSDSLEIGARKFPAAPVDRSTRESISVGGECSEQRSEAHTANDKVDSAKLFDGFRNGILHLFRVPHVCLCGETFVSGSG